MATLSWFQTWDSDGGFVGFRRDDLKADKPISMVGGKLYRNGVRFRICGEHLSNGCAGPDDAGEAAGLAQRWAGLGFNMARWLSFDSSTSANESLWVWNVGTPTLSTIDATFVDRMDKLLYELKERGIYAWLTFGQ